MLNIFFLILIFSQTMISASLFRKVKPYLWETVNIPIIDGYEINEYAFRFKLDCDLYEGSDLNKEMQEIYFDYCKDLIESRIYKPLNSFCTKSKVRSKRLITAPFVYDLYNKNSKLVENLEKLRNETHLKLEDFFKNSTFLNLIIHKLNYQVDSFSHKIESLEILYDNKDFCIIFFLILVS